MKQADLVAAGFKRLDSSLLERPDKIKWGELYKNNSLEKRLKYAERLASSMNHAARLIQDERDKLNDLCFLKEQQLQKMLEAVRQNNEMLQTQVTKMNEQRQGYNKHVAELNAEIRKLKNGIVD